jgi:Terminase large subunit, T4likevirus-type, N-terminal
MDPLTTLALELDPSRLMDVLGLDPDPWQRQVLRSTAERILMLCCRQSGKSTTAAALALHTALFRPGALVLLLSPTLRQSGELFRKVTTIDDALGRPVPAVQESATTLLLANGSRVVSLPGSHETVRGFSAATLVVIDEAALTDDALLTAIGPMLAVSRGRLVCLSTPMGRRGWFHAAWSGPGEAWERTRITAEDCPRIGAGFLAEQRQLLGERWFRQEYMCSFEETIDQVFATEAVEGAFTSDRAPLFGG